MGIDDVIGSVTGTATFQRVEVEPGDANFINVTGYYHGDTTTYQVPAEYFYIGGVPVSNVEDVFVLDTPTESDYLWVEATEEELRITTEKPEQ